MLEAFDHLFHQVPNLSLRLISPKITTATNRVTSEKRSTRTPEWIPRMQPPLQWRVGIKMAQIGERIERSESLPSPTGRFDGSVPLMFHPSALPFAASRHFDHLLPSLVNMSGPSFGQRAIALTTSSCHRAWMPVQCDGGFPPLENVPPFLSSGR